MVGQHWARECPQHLAQRVSEPSPFLWGSGPASCCFLSSASYTCFTQRARTRWGTPLERIVLTTNKYGRDSRPTLPFTHTSLSGSAARTGAPGLVEGAEETCFSTKGLYPCNELSAIALQARGNCLRCPFEHLDQGFAVSAE